uniref:transcriptional corepressor LEUNIG-like n=1 Tax=Erigeron canadensis TaxID=72917 RepID=UPI001CB8F2EA|nr:transcriptional corepressor LEUNIG-like [Erigeron canadensis]
MSQSSQHHQSIMDVDTMLDVYILDYLVKRKLITSAKVFEDEAKVPANVRAIHAPRGFLFEWWTVFWDIFVSRYKLHQGSMEPCDEAMRVLHMMQQQEGQHQRQTVNANNAVNVKSPWVAETSTPMRQPFPRDINSLMGSYINQSAQGPEGLPTGAHATGVSNNVPLKGWPLMGPDQIQSRLHQQQAALQPPPLSCQQQIEIQAQLLNERKRSQMEGQIQVPNERKRSQLDGQVQPPNERKRNQIEGQFQPPMENITKHALISSAIVNSQGTPNVNGVFSNLAGEVSMPSSPHNEKINIDDFLNYGALDGNDSSFSSRAGKEAEVHHASSGFKFLEIGSVHMTSVNCCDISFDGKLVAIGGEDKKARLWCSSSRESKATLDEHSQAITDIRFSPSMLRLATSSHDKTIRIWDLENLGSSIRTFTGHSASVTSLDFHPKKEDLVCSCDETEIRYWTIKNSGCVQLAKGGASQVRFQCGIGKHLAAVHGNTISLLDLERPQARKHVLKSHTSNVQSICWDFSGELLISVSEDSLKIWRMDSGGKADCIRELSVSGKRFHCATFHPIHPSIVIIGCHKSLELWNMAENILMTPNEEPVSALAVSSTSGLIVSGGHNDSIIKIWK